MIALSEPSFYNLQYYSELSALFTAVGNQGIHIYVSSDLGFWFRPFGNGMGERERYLQHSIESTKK
jgi:hypothetical protein